MSVFSRLNRLFSTKASAISSMVSIFNLGQPVWTDRRYDQFADEGYQKNAVVFAAIREISKGVSSVKIKLYKHRGDTKAEVLNHPLLDLMHKPNPMQGGTSFMEALCSYYQIAGNSYIEFVGPERGIPTELYAHRPDRIKVMPGDGGIPFGYEYSVNGQTKIWKTDSLSGASPIMHIKSFNPLSDWYGMSAMEAAAYSIDIHNDAGAWNKALLQNSARPSGALVHDSGPSGSDLTDPQYKRLKAEILESYTGVNNTGRPMLLTGGLDWKEMGLSPKDMEYIESKHTSARDIALVFGVPPQLLGIPGDNTYSNQREARYSMWENTILILLGFFLNEFNRGLVPLFGDDLELGYDADDISALSPRREATWSKVKGADFLTDNEKRAAVGYGPIEGGDVLFKPFTSLSTTPAPSKGAKAVNLPDEAARESEWVAQVRLIDGLSMAAEVGLSKILSDQINKSSVEFKAGGRVALEESLQGHEETIVSLLASHYKTVTSTFSVRFLEGLKVSGPSETKTHDEGNFNIDEFALVLVDSLTNASFQETLLDWIDSNSLNKAKLISETTKEQLLEIIRLGEENGFSQDRIAKLISKKLGKEIAFKRARVIARTETHTAAVAANDIVAGSTGIKFKRRWLSARDEKVRDSHSAIDREGQTVDMVTPFTINGVNGPVKLMRPGDPSGPPEETINCRCVVDYIV